jgi:hypothetical protein
MRVFTGLLFLGSGEFSVRDVGVLRERLREGISLSGGLQQSSQGMPEDDAQTARLEADLEDVVRDIVAALLGQDVTFGARLPYPPGDDERVRDYAEKLKDKLARQGSRLVDDV